MGKISKAFRLSGSAVERLERLAREWEMPQTLVIEQLLKLASEAETNREEAHGK
jgi:predicted transcriptional regulator